MVISCITKSTKLQQYILKYQYMWFVSPMRCSMWRPGRWWWRGQGWGRRRWSGSSPRVLAASNRHRWPAASRVGHSSYGQTWCWSSRSRRNYRHKTQLYRKVVQKNAYVLFFFIFLEKFAHSCQIYNYKNCEVIFLKCHTFCIRIT